jgi:hypothetical protein
MSADQRVVTSHHEPYPTCSHPSPLLAELLAFACSARTGLRLCQIRIVAFSINDSLPVEEGGWQADGPIRAKFLAQVRLIEIRRK